LRIYIFLVRIHNFPVIYTYFYIIDTNNNHDKNIPASDYTFYYNIHFISTINSPLLQSFSSTR
ncbi:MAG: hypothetical protein KAH95_14940, partial [Spirochaetales bacterium]|nr:hypothetical protein [Spirochaetales bacterium]